LGIYNSIEKIEKIHEFVTACGKNGRLQIAEMHFGLCTNREKARGKSYEEVERQLSRNGPESQCLEVDDYNNFHVVISETHARP
jgi:ssDNA-binding Zn-finger/Zn-ribbon topoisomerase 1